MPTLDEVLASFRTSPSSNDDFSWPGNTGQINALTSSSPHEAAPLQQSPMPIQPQQVEPDRSYFPEPSAPPPASDGWGRQDFNLENQPLPIPQPPMLPYSAFDNFGSAPSESNLASALEMLAGTSRREPAPPPAEIPSSFQPVEPVEPLAAFPERRPTPELHISQELQPFSSGSLMDAPDPAQGKLLPALGELYDEADALNTQATSFKNMLAQLKSAAVIVETQRTEFKGFLDGSKDALDRMERWAGKAMGLNLRNSPEQVRRFLPLSVMWVTNTKLKKVLDVMTNITTSGELTEEQMRSTMQQMHESLDSCNTAFQQLQSESASPDFKQNSGWGDWEMSRARDAENLRERVTFERQGDLSALRAEIENQVRYELEHQIREEILAEQQPITLATRAELERQIREELRRESEANRQLHQRVAGTSTYAGETPEEMEERLYNEIEIKVRRDFLSQIDAGTLAIPRQVEAPQKDTSWSFAGEADAAAEIAPVSPQQMAYSASHAPVSQPLPRPSQAPAASTSSMGADFAEEAAEIFRAEAEEHLQTISMSVAALEKNPNDRDLIQSIRRATHTLKGAAGMMGFQAIADLSHISEDLLDSIMEGTTQITSEALGLILDTAETLDVLINGNNTDYNTDALLQNLRVRYVQLLGDLSHANQTMEDYIDPEEVDSNMMSSMVDDGSHGETNAPQTARSDLSVRVPLQKLDELVNLFGEMLVNRSVLEERLERLVRLVSDVDVSSARLRDVGQKLESRFEVAMLPSGRSIQVLPGSVGNNGSAPGIALSGPLSNGNIGRGSFGDRNEPKHFDDFDELELDRYTEFHQLSRGLSEGISDMMTLSTEMDSVIRECEGIFGRENRLNATFQDRLMKARLVPLSSMVPRIYRASRSVALKQHKEFELLLEGEETEVDRTVFEEIAGPLLHLMRNAVNHAIETPERRVQAGKSPAGQIKLSASYEGNQVVITVRDDGKGIEPERVRNTAINRGLISPQQQLSDHDMIDLIFRPGFSTAEVLSEESGRGVGLDVVRDSVSRLRGTLEVETMPGQGTAFTMKFPTSLAIQSAMTVKVADQQFAIPTVVVESIGRLDNFKRSTLAGRPAVLVQNDLYPLNSLAQFLSLPVSPVEEKAPLLLVNTGRHRMALIVDDIRGKVDVVMKNLGPHLRHVHGIAGGTVLGNGRVVLILELLELLTSHAPAGNVGGNQNVLVPGNYASITQAMRLGGEQARQSINAAPDMRRGVPAKPPVAPPQPEHGKHILVVDDSPSVRRVVSTMLKQHGWEVQMARDGVEALEMITHETPAAVLLDIEMPRMDGYELMATVRAQEQYRTLPLVVLTSRAATKHQQRAMQLGASGYVVKPYQDEELIKTLNTLVYGAPVR